MSPKLHALLRRQLKRLGLSDESAPPNAVIWPTLLERVTRAYEDHDQERYLLERSQSLASEEMAHLHQLLRDERDQLESRVRERTEALRLSEARLQSLLSLSADWIWEQDEDLRFTYISEGIESAHGVAPSMFLGERQLSGAGAFEAPPEEMAAYQECIAARRAFRDFTCRFIRPDGVQVFVRISGEPVFDTGGNFKGYRGVTRNVTEAMLAEQKMQELARYDSLTRLPNRNMFLGELDRTIARVKRHGGGFALCFIDLDRFKSINDSLGHHAGDELLRAMADRLTNVLRASDLVARLGGDEFVVLLEGHSSVADLSAMAHSLLAAIGNPLTIQGRSLLITGSIGVGLYPADGHDAATLLKHADAAMYLAKEKGKNNVQFYTEELADMAARQFELESALRLALVGNEFVLHFQPKFDVRSGQVLSLEALVRWMHPNRGLVAPNDFIPLAEECGLIVPIGRWVIRQTCRQISEWRRAGLASYPVAVNLSAKQFADNNLVHDIEEAMAAYVVNPAEFEIELTESVLMADPERANQVLQHLHSLGVKISIDDFGTGYSSLSYLKRFPADSVKIDGSFVSGLPKDADDAAITQAVIAMAHSLGLKVVAECVETSAQLAVLRTLGCDEAQGFLLARPMSATDAARWLQSAGDRAAASVA